MHVVEQPTPGNDVKIEADFLGITDVLELSDHRFSFWALIPAGDGEIGNLPVLTIDPEIEIQTANFALRLSPILTKEFSQTGGVNVVGRCIRGGIGRLGCDQAPVNVADEVLRVDDPR